MAHRPKYSAKVIATGETREVWKSGSTNEWCDYLDPKITYKPEELEVGNVVPDKE